jgi:hypothetical protein
MASWPHSYLTIVYNCKDTWINCYMAMFLYGETDVRLYCYIDTWLYGKITTWLNGYMASYLQCYVATWLFSAWLHVYLATTLHDYIGIHECCLENALFLSQSSILRRAVLIKFEEENIQNENPYSRSSVIRWAETLISRAHMQSY